MLTITRISALSILYGLTSGLSPAAADPGSIELFISAAGSQNQDYLDQTMIPTGFGDGEFTLELWIRPNNNYPVGTVNGGEEQRINWAVDDVEPYSTGSWWYKGNFLLDGHNNGSGFSLGTFSLQFYGGGRVRWLFGDGSNSIPWGGVWSVGAYPASSTFSLLDGNWHQVTLVRRWTGSSSALLELWVDGNPIATETSDVRRNMRDWWDSWTGFPSGQEGWFWGAEKQAVVGIRSQYEDYKGLIDEIRFWSRAKTAGEISSGYAAPVTGSEAGIVARYAFGEGQGTSICDTFQPNRCMFLGNSSNAAWSADGAPLNGTGDTTPPSTPTGLQGAAQSESSVSLSWNPASDNVGVTSYVVRRGGAIITSTPNTNFVDSGLQPATAYGYTVAARDAAGNESPQSAQVSVTTLAGPDTTPPSVPGNLQGAAVSPNRIDLSWNASTDNVAVSGYLLYRDGIQVASPSGTTFSDTGLVANTAYAYTVAARDAAGNQSANSMPVMVTTLASPDTEAPSVPSNLQGSAASSSAVSLSWTASSDNIGVASYEIQRNGVVVGTTTGTSFRVTGLAPGTTYAFSVVAVDLAGNRSTASLSVSVTTAAAPAGNSGGGGTGAILLAFIAATLMRRRLGSRRFAWMAARSTLSR